MSELLGIAVLVYSASSGLMHRKHLPLRSDYRFNQSNALLSIFTDYYLPLPEPGCPSILLFVCSGIYARVLSETGSAAAIAYKIIDAFVRKG